MGYRYEVERASKCFHVRAIRGHRYLLSIQANFDIKYRLGTSRTRDATMGICGEKQSASLIQSLRKSFLLFTPRLCCINLYFFDSVI